MRSGLGIRPELFEPVFAEQPDLGFLEAHSENYFGESIARAKLLELRERYPISLHGVGLSLGRADNLCQQHLAELKALVDEVDPLFVSEHLAWSAYTHRHAPDLLPLPLTDEALAVMCEHIDQMQTALGRQILLENPSNYVVFDQLQISEPEFLNTLAERTGCGLLVDVNNIHVSASNVGRDSAAYIKALNTNAIGQYHLAGYTQVSRDIGGVEESVLIDTHNQTVFEPVWDLFRHALAEHGARPTLFEWDSDFPEFAVILGECHKADALLAQAEMPRSGNRFASAPLGSRAESIEPSLAKSQGEFLDSIFTLEPSNNEIIQTHQHRVWIYQNNTFGAVQDYLQHVFPATCGVVGSEFFKQMSQQFIQNNPPSSGNIHEFGVQFVDSLASVDGLQDLHYLADLVRYEWALHSAYYSVVSDSLEPTSMPQEQLLVSDIEFNRSVSLVLSDYPISEIHRQSLPEFSEPVAIDLNQSQDHLLIYKTEHQVKTRALNSEESLFLQEIQKSDNLLQAIETLQGSISAETLSQTLAFIFDVQILKLALSSEVINPESFASEQAARPALH